MSCKRTSLAIILVVAVSALLAILFFCLSACAGVVLAVEYSSEPVYEINAQMLQPEYEGKMVRLRGDGERIPDSKWRAKLGVFEVCHGSAFGPMYKRQKHPDVNKEMFLVGRQCGNRIIVWYHFYGSWWAWKLCTHKLVIYPDGILSTGFFLSLFVVAWLLGALMCRVVRGCCRGRFGVLLSFTLYLVPPLAYLVGLLVFDFSLLVDELKLLPMLLILGVLVIPLAFLLVRLVRSRNMLNNNVNNLVK